MINGQILGPKLSKYRYFGISAKFFRNKFYQNIGILVFNSNFYPIKLTKPQNNYLSATQHAWKYCKSKKMIFFAIDGLGRAFMG